MFDPAGTLEMQVSPDGSGRWFEHWSVGSQAADALDLWVELDRHFSQTNPQLRNFSPEELQQRWRRGEAAVAVYENRIIAHISLLEVVSVARRSALEQDKRIQFPLKPRIWESSVGWTEPAFRRQGLQRALRCKLYERIPPEDLMVSFCVGVGAGPVLSSLGWHVSGWNTLALVGQLIAHFGDDTFTHHRGHTIGLNGRKAYEGEGQYPDSKPQHEWDRYVHLWVRDLPLAYAANQKLYSCLNHIPVSAAEQRTL